MDEKILDLIGKTNLPDPDGEFEKLRTAHARGSLDVKTLLYRDDFARAMTLWLKNMKYQIGLDPKDFTADQAVKWAKHLASFCSELFSASMPMFISGGATSEQTFPVLVPFLPLADLVAFQVKLGTPMLVLVIFADGLAPDALHQRFDQFLTLAKPMPQFGMRLNGNASGPAAIYPLLIYFDQGSYQSAVKELLPSGRVTKIWDHLNLVAGFVNIPGKQVIWPEMHGVLAGFGSWLTKVTGTKPYPFETADLQIVLTIADQARH